MIDSNSQDYDEKTNKQDSKIDKLTSMVKNMMDGIQISNYSPENMDLTNAQYPTTMFPDNKKAPPLEGGYYTKMVAYGLSNMIPAHQNYINSS